MFFQAMLLLGSRRARCNGGSVLRRRWSLWWNLSWGTSGSLYLGSLNSRLGDFTWDLSLWNDFGVRWSGSENWWSAGSWLFGWWCGRFGFRGSRRLAGRFCIFHGALGCD